MTFPSMTATAAKDAAASVLTGVNSKYDAAAKLKNIPAHNIRMPLQGASTNMSWCPQRRQVPAATTSSPDI